KRGSQKVMKLSAEGRRRHFLAHFFENLETLHPLFEFSNAKSGINLIADAIGCDVTDLIVSKKISKN
ncbi:MAG: hypothetical protein EBX50_12570, partial [Chitinophagia bacterium]|nr:hypothetical protein [Chitinophagia bacterium]